MGSFLFLPILPAFRGRHGYRLALVVSSKALTRDSRVQAALSPAGRQGKVRGGIQASSSHPAEGETDSSTPIPSSASRANCDRVPAADRGRKLPMPAEDRVGHWIDERIDLHIYAEIWKAVTPAHLIDVAVFCASDDPHTGTAAERVG